MSMMAQMLVAYEMFKDYMKQTFGGGSDFFQPLVPGYNQQGWVK